MGSIDVIVPTYNRPLDIRKFISEIEKQTFNDYKVYIVDDCGIQSPESEIPLNDPKFNYIRLDKNKGQAFARNEGIKKSTADILVSMDDDAWFVDNEALIKVSNFFNKYPDTACLMFDIKTPDRDWISKEKKINNDISEIGTHITCGCAYDRKKFDKVRGFSGFLHSQGEESDLSFKFIKNGFKIRFTKDIKVFHNYVPGERSDDWYFKSRYNTSRNDLLIVWMRYPIIWIVPYTIGKLFGHIRFVLKQKRKPIKSVLVILSSFFGAIRYLPQVLSERDPISLSQFQNWLKIRW